MKCLKCDKETTNPKYCSQSCATSCNNLGRRRHGNPPKTCIVCGKVGASSTGKYCSNACQVEDRYRRAIETWLQGDKVLSPNKNPNWIRRYLSEQQHYQCAICSHSQWNNKPLLLIIDHIDGNCENSTRENMRVICSNCDSQLPTYKGRNRGKGRYTRRLRYRKGQSY